MPSSGQFSSSAAPAPDLLQAVLENDLNRSERLLEVGADPNVSGPLGMTALMIARTLEMTELLMRHGAALDKVDDTGATALTHQVNAGAIDIVRRLLDAGTDATIRDAIGRTALDRARIRKSDSVYRRSSSPETFVQWVRMTRAPKDDALVQLLQRATNAAGDQSRR